ncbi:MAG TPA: glycosyltransferase family 1 protein, partial [Thermoanaerobaculia bacterium]|nr:glycosyltransferase family 1 protein [Thermoanaerobaculia bacterium]
MRIVQVVPRLPPPAEGVGSYALELARALAERHGTETLFHAASAHPPSHRAGALEEALEEARPSAVLLHYVNYGYQQRGCPVWLLHTLRRWRRGGTGRRLVTVFHEVYATGPPWRSSFWTMPLQRGIAAAM